MKSKEQIEQALNRELDLQDEWELWDGERRMEYSNGLCDALYWVLERLVSAEYQDTGLDFKKEEKEDWQTFMNRKLNEQRERIEHEMSHMQKRDKEQ